MSIILYKNPEKANNLIFEYIRNHMKYALDNDPELFFIYFVELLNFPLTKIIADYFLTTLKHNKSRILIATEKKHNILLGRKTRIDENGNNLFLIEKFTSDEIMFNIAKLLLIKSIDKNEIENLQNLFRSDFINNVDSTPKFFQVQAAIKFNLLNSIGLAFIEKSITGTPHFIVKPSCKLENGILYRPISNYGYDESKKFDRIPKEDIEDVVFNEEFLGAIMLLIKNSMDAAVNYDGNFDFAGSSNQSNDYNENYKFAHSKTNEKINFSSQSKGYQYRYEDLCSFLPNFMKNFTQQIEKLEKNIDPDIKFLTQDFVRNIDNFLIDNNSKKIYIASREKKLKDLFAQNVVRLTTNFDEE